MRKTIIFALFMMLIFLFGCTQSNKLEIEVDSASAETAEETVEETAEAAETTETTEIPVVASSGLQAIQTEKPKEGKCERVGVRWAGCDKVDGSNTDLLITMLNGGDGELPGFWLYYKMKDGAQLYQEYKGTIIFNTTTTFPIDISEADSMNGGITKVYVYPEQDIDGTLTVCNALPIGAFVPETNCKEESIRID